MRRRAERRPPVRGFGLLEAVVALTLLASTGMALFAWLNLNLQTASRLAATEARARLLLSAQAAMVKVNPSSRPDGTISLAGLTVRWQSVQVQPERRNATQIIGMPGPWIVSLYRMEINAQDGDGTEIRFSQLQVGTRRTLPAARAP